jgi:hypothetical protein
VTKYPSGVLSPVLDALAEKKSVKIADPNNTGLRLIQIVRQPRTFSSIFR